MNNLVSLTNFGFKPSAAKVVLQKRVSVDSLVMIGPGTQQITKSGRWRFRFKAWLYKHIVSTRRREMLSEGKELGLEQKYAFRAILSVVSVSKE